MRNKWIKRLFPLIAFLLLAPWPVAYAHNYANTYTNDAFSQGNAVKIEIAEDSVAPSWNVIRNSIGGVHTPGTLFYVDATNYPADINGNLYITNTKELVHCYRYLLLKVGIYVEGIDGSWEKVPDARDEELNPDTFITLHDAQTSFILPGCARYKITIDDGSFYCNNTTASEGTISPAFYLTVD